MDFKPDMDEDNGEAYGPYLEKNGGVYLNEVQKLSCTIDVIGTTREENNLVVKIITHLGQR